MKKKYETRTSYIHVRDSERNVRRIERLSKIYGYEYAEWVREACRNYNPEVKNEKKR